MSNFLLELLIEEIPSRFQAEAASNFEKIILDEFSRLKIPFQNIRSFVSPRRLTFSAELAEKTLAYQEEKKGPQTVAPTEIIDKFLKSNNASRDDCIEKTIDRKNFIFINIYHDAIDTAALLPDIIKKAIENISWKKSMKWGNYPVKFVRPLRNILAVFNGQTINFSMDEIHIKASNDTVGHRFLAPAQIHVKNFEEYQEKLKNAFVIIDQNERKSIILEEIRRIENIYNLSVIITPDLLEEVIGLSEYPVPLVGKVPNNFMQLPEEAIITPMKVHQRYFPTRTDDGKLAPYFVFVANNQAIDNGKTIIEGNEKVLNARLADALFFFETDSKKPLESHLESLKKIGFHERLGTVFDRVQRVISLCHFAYDNLRENNSFITDKTKNLLIRSATLAKCDLSSGMVCEFTELQGIMGAHYAKIQGESDEICIAIREQYSQGDDFSTPFSALFSLIDKVEIITGFFDIGKEPTGSKDPFALRRAAISILKIIQKFKMRIDLRALIQKAFDNMTFDNLKSDTVDNVINFINERFKVLLKDNDVDYEIITALINSGADILLIYQKSEILNRIIKTDAGKRLIEGYKRAKNIIGDNINTEVNKFFLSENEETLLYNAVLELQEHLQYIEQTENDIQTGFVKELNACVKMEKVISQFFEKVLVNTGDSVIKQNRLNLLTKLVQLFGKVIPLW